MTTEFRDTSGRFGSSHNDDDCSSLGSNVDESEIDIDFSLTESGRTVAHLVAAMKDDEEDDVDFEITESGRTVGMYSSGGESTSQNRTTDPLPVALPTRTQAVSKPIPTPNSDFQSGSAGSSGSAFLSGIMNPPGATQLSHTPPNFTPSSYEAQHFGKRQRSGSISGRLRSASELEDAGLIDRHQKGILKDLIISGDEELQAALDKYELGDKATLEDMIKSGRLLNRASADINLLDELDLDFLTVDDHAYTGMELPNHPAAPENILNIPFQGSQSVPMPMLPTDNLATKQQAQQRIAMSNQPKMVSPSAYEGDDGIGDLEFNADFSGHSDEYLKLPTQAFGPGKTVPSPNILEEQQRFRSNSLAFGALLGDAPSSQEGHEMYGGWLDRRMALDSSSPQVSQVPSPGMSPGDGLFMLNPMGENSMQQGQGGIGASLAQYGRSKSESRIKTKSELAADRRREKQERKDQREREKREKKQRREQESREKKARDAREKQERKDKKAAAKAKPDRKGDGEERQETPSGLGRPRSMSDPNLKTSMDGNGLLQVERPDGWIGAYSPESRKIRIERFLAKRNRRVWTKTVKYDVRKNFADSRLRVKGRFVKKEDELLMRDLMSLT